MDHPPPTPLSLGFILPIMLLIFLSEVCCPGPCETYNPPGSSNQLGIPETHERLEAHGWHPNQQLTSTPPGWLVQEYGLILLYIVVVCFAIPRCIEFYAFRDASYTREKSFFPLLRCEPGSLPLWVLEYLWHWLNIHATDEWKWKWPNRWAQTPKGLLWFWSPDTVRAAREPLIQSHCPTPHVSHPLRGFRAFQQQSDSWRFLFITWILDSAVPTYCSYHWHPITWLKLA